MAKRQTRRCVSMKGLTYQRLKKFCHRQDVSVSGYLELLIADAMDEWGVPEETKLEPVRRGTPAGRPPACFTF